MAVGNFNLPLNIHNIQQQPIRNRPDRYAQTPLAERFRFEVSEGVRPAEFLGVYKYLPVQQKDITTEDYIVLPKGRIVSAISSEDELPAGGMVTPSGEGTIYSFTSATTGSLVSRSIDNSFWGYDEDINGLVVPCNGGTNSLAYYSAADALNGTITNSGTLAAAGDGLVIPANFPIGVVYHDWYQDIRGRDLNYQMWPDGGHVLCDWYVEVPFVKVTSGANWTPLGSGITPVAEAYNLVDYVSKYDINKKFTYLAVNVDTDTFRPGVFIQSDLVGNYKYQGVGNKTVQTVGRLMSVDNRYPKNGMEDVQTYPGSNMPGTQTAGLPGFLFEFVYACQLLTGTAPTVEEILNYVQAGYYGVAKIQLSIA